MEDMKRKKIVVMGGGTGTFTVLSGLKHYPVDLSAIVSIADNGGSTGILRDELGVLPPGDTRQCLVALSAGDDLLRSLFNYRFAEGSLTGHNFGNLFLSALEKVTGDSLSAVREAHRILNVKGRVIPVAAKATHLFAELEDGQVVEGEHAIDELEGERAPIARCFLSPAVTANQDAIDAIESADAIILGPGDLYTSLMPILLVEGIREALARSSAKRFYVLNLVTKHGETDGYTAKTYAEVIKKALAPAKLDTVLVNTEQPPDSILARYQKAAERPVTDDLTNEVPEIARSPLLSNDIQEPKPGDQLKRSLLRHDPVKLAEAILSHLK